MRAFVAILVLTSFVSLQSVAQNEAKEKLEVEFAPQGGTYSGAPVVELFAPLGAKIFYTTDGSYPKPSRANKYEGPILVEETAVIRAIAYKNGRKSKPIGHTYLIQEPDTKFPVVSLAIEPEILFDMESGLFMKGTNVVDSLWRKPGANFWSRREHSLNVEIFENDGQCIYRDYSGLRLFGGMSRLFPQKSMAIVARKRYGNKRIRHRIFGKEGLKKFKYLVLRNSGSDFSKSHFRDGLMTTLVKDWDLETQDFRPALVYINGRYWGIYNIREKVNRYFIAGHHDVHKDSIDLMEHRMSRKRGHRHHYAKMVEFIKNNDLSKPANYAWVAGQMEIDNFIDYQIAQIFFDNRDAGGNIKYWRPQTEEGKWRWILYDTDWGFGLHDKDAYAFNSLAFHTEPNGPSWPNPPWSTLILRKLLENKSFQERFITRFSDRLNTAFDSDLVLGQIEYFYQRLQPEMPRHLQRWRRPMQRWKDEVEKMRVFAAERPEFVWGHLQEYFDLGERNKIELESTHGGHVMLNEHWRIDQAFAGEYFEDMPIKLQAVPHLGYRFTHWESNRINSESKDLTLQLDQPVIFLKAVFEKFEHPLKDKVIINEVSANNRATGDWLEIYNYSEERVNLNQWMFTDNKNRFYFPNVNLDAKDYLILCEDSAAFVKAFPKAYNVIGGLGFGLNKHHETLKLFAPQGAAVDSVAYRLEPTDSIFTLNLLLPWLENGDSENWEVLKGWGSPNAANAYYVQSTIQARREQWMQMGVAAAVAIICIVLLIFRRRKLI